MNYKDYAKRCQWGRSWARSKAVAPDLCPVKRSEFFILGGHSDSARAAVDGIVDSNAAYLQAIKASRHFEDSSFMEGHELPAASTSDWTLPVLRAACSVAKRDGDGERLERYIASSPRVAGVQAIRALMVVSNAYRNAGSLATSRRVLLEAFQLTPRNVEPPIKKSKLESDLSFAKKRQTAFHDLLQVINFRQHSVFPCSGTLLGFYRDSDFIPTDGDVDLGCLDPVGFESIRKGLRESGCFYLSPGRLDTNFNAKHANDAKIDVSLYVPRDDGWAKTSHVYEWRFEKFQLGELATDYGRLPVPEPAEAYLSAMYEDWWVPRSGYDSRIDSPNLRHVSPEEVAIVMASHLLAAHLTEGPEASARWKRKLERLPEEIWSDVARIIASLC